MYFNYGARLMIFESLLYKDHKITDINSKKLIIFTVIAGFTILNYGLGFRINYQPDVYLRVNVAHEYYTEQIVGISDGRFLNLIIMWILRWLPFRIYYYVALVLGMTLISLASGCYVVELIHNIEYALRCRITNINTIVLSLLCCVTIENVFSSEYFLYIDSTVGWTLAIYLSVRAAVLMIRYLRLNRVNNLFTASMLAVLVPFIYEPISSVFIILTIPFILLHSLSVVEFFKNQIIAGLIYIFGIMTRTVYIRVIEHNKRAQFDAKSFAESVESYSLPTGRSPKQFLLDRITLGMWGYVILCLVVGLLFLFWAIRNKQYVEIIKFVYICCLVIIAGLLPFIAKLTNDYKPRIYYPLGMLFGIMVIYGVLRNSFPVFSIIDTKNVYIAMIVALFFIQWFSFLQMYTDCYTTNYEDQYISRMIDECIKKYENAHNRKIEFVTFYDDAVRTKYCRVGWCLTQRAYSSWGNLSALNYWTGKNYKQGSIDNDLADYYINRNWDTFSEDQISFIDDTAHICMY